HVDMACWKGRLYVGWNSCQRDEDVWPSRELFSTSVNGIEWTEPAEMFPQGLSRCLRMYFYHAANGRMLCIAGLRNDLSRTNEDTKGPLVVREIRPDHSWGDVFTLQRSAADAGGPDLFEQSPDSGFVEACRQLLADTVFLEQQDRGRLLGSRRMKWHEPSAWPAGKVPGDNEKWVAGKAYSFFRRPDGAIVGVSKMGWTTISFDDGKTWAQPLVPQTLVTGKAKVWGQRTADGRYVLVYNPSRKNRYPLVVVTSDDGVTYSDMRIVQGELPIQRYEGADRSIGPQYVRGISHWSDDGSRAPEPVLWLVYSMNKEDIWVSRVPLPIRAEVAPNPGGREGPALAARSWEDWNLYVPKWAKIDPIEGGLRLENCDPYDYAAATWVFGQMRRVIIRFQITAIWTDRGMLDIDVASKFGSKGSVRLSLIQGGQLALCGGDRFIPVGRCRANEPVEVTLAIDAGAQRWMLTVKGRDLEFQQEVPFSEPAEDVHRIIFRTGGYRGVGGKKPVPIGTDRPTEPCAFEIRDLRASAGET
ncbi:MAG: hypothetical protein RMJ35_10635, partial [Phycisphaerales bacterium]|nr:hypothetical protein [Phycisphaerales bacterium]